MKRAAPGVFTSFASVYLYTARCFRGWTHPRTYSSAAHLHTLPSAPVLYSCSHPGRPGPLDNPPQNLASPQPAVRWSALRSHWGFASADSFLTILGGRELSSNLLCYLILCSYHQVTSHAHLAAGAGAFTGPTIHLITKLVNPWSFSSCIFPKT